MLASVSPASYRAMISGQSDCGIFPLLFDFSITKDLESTFTFLPALGPLADSTDSEPGSPEGSDRRKRDGDDVAGRNLADDPMEASSVPPADETLTGH